MGISSNQARFLALTSRQVDLERRIQQICQRRLRLTSELENVATSYNNQISNRRLYAMNTTTGGIDELTIANFQNLKDSNGNKYMLMGQDILGQNTLTIEWRPTTGAGLDTPPPGTAFRMECLGALNPTASDGWISFAQLGLDPATATEGESLSAAIKMGFLKVLKVSDEYTQTPITAYYDTVAPAIPVDSEEVDWRTIPGLADELYKGDDVDAENKYDKTIAEINSQDKKLQLEQTSIEVEYKAVSSERESVKKILDTNAQSSFKYFS